MIRYRLKLALASIVPAWLVVTLLLYVWGPLIDGTSCAVEAAVIAPQVVLAMAFFVTPLLQRLVGTPNTQTSSAP